MSDDGMISLDVERFAKVVLELEKTADHTEPTMKVAAEMLVTEVQDRWRSAGDGQWDPLSPATLERRRGNVAQILMDTGRAIGSVNPESGTDFAAAVTDTDYMRYHCGDGPRTKIPKRDPFEISDAAEERVMDFVLADMTLRWAQGIKS